MDKSQVIFGSHSACKGTAPWEVGGYTVFAPIVSLEIEITALQ
jgi:hypothetical protein